MMQILTRLSQRLPTTSGCSSSNPLRCLLRPYGFTSQAIIADATFIAPTTTTSYYPYIVTASSPQKRLFSNYNQLFSFFQHELSSTALPTYFMHSVHSPNNPNEGRRRHLVVVTNTSSSDISTKSNTKPNMKKKKVTQPRQFIPPKAAIQLTSKARIFCRELLENTSNPEIAGIILRFQQSASGEPRMVFSFDFVMTGDLGKDDEGVSLEVLEDGTPTPPIESMNDGKRKLYLHQSAILKVMGGTLDIAMRDDESGKGTKVITPIMHDREGNEMDPNV